MSRCYCGNKDDYEKFLSGEKEWNKRNKQYKDPDGQYGDYYTNLVTFLNVQEYNYFEEEDRWTYVLQKQYGPISICAMDKLNKIKFFIRSDQMGFSAPQGEADDRSRTSNYPYGHYLKLTETDEDKREEAVKFVAKCVFETRTLGGGFLWPLSCSNNKKVWRSEYNLARGISSYIEDSVDLTLLEIKHYYDWNGNEEYPHTNDILWKKEIRGNQAYIREWLNHFRSFQRYVCFFCFEDFINKESFMPLSIEDPQKALIEEDVDKIRKSYKKKNENGHTEIVSSRLYDIKKPDELKGVLDNVRKLILDRTERMKEVIRNGIY